MATADGTAAASSRTRRLVPVAFVAALAIAIGVGLSIGSDEATAPPASSMPEPVAVEATSIYQFATLAEMVAASDAIVVGRVVATEPGRLVGDPANGGVISRIVTIAVDEVLAGEPATTVIVEEEGTLPDGTPIVVNGVPGSTSGDRGIWFLDRLDDAEVPAFLVINSQGRYLTASADPSTGTLEGGDQRDALVQELQGQPLDALVASVRALVEDAP